MTVARAVTALVGAFPRVVVLPLAVAVAVVVALPAFSFAFSFVLPGSAPRPLAPAITVVVVATAPAASTGVVVVAPSTRLLPNVLVRTVGLDVVLCSPTLGLASVPLGTVGSLVRVSALQPGRSALWL